MTEQRYRSHTDSIYGELDVPTVVNAAGTKTRIGGSLIRDEALEAMHSAASAFVELGDLQAAASDRIAEVTGAEAGYVTSGAAAGLCLCAAAAIAGHDVAAMEQLPDTEGLPGEILMPRTHRTGYDHALRTAGATIVDVGTNDLHLGTGSTSVEPWELESNITDETAAIAYIEKSYTEPPLDVVADIAHDHDIPVIVDAAAELPPRSNFSRFIDQGADMVVFSGGKGIRGPQTTGIIAGKQEYIESIAMQHLDMHVAEAAWSPPERLVDLDNFAGVPRQGIGRPMKVGKEELAGLIYALDAFLEEEQTETQSEWQRRADDIAHSLEDAGFGTHVTGGSDVSVAPEVVVDVDSSSETTALELVRRLRAENPRVYLGSDRLDEGIVVANPMCLTDEEADYVVDRIVANVEN
ncbi:aminotransferase class V-fold PLP-dependent enzyme [Haloferax larsenii]|uniref:Aminotransferase class V-fold PLP-dependent enzyme n=1 Tax=Haloferax larsenii TaxID=302484 RepID=A0ABY5REV7_HALLR|nr:aminotransferase class V-fold PLP-dependent enzyme [Haloferax larsenii]ELZ79453.1 L-seryl-tRNA(Ser) seleniumtransferase [Haloferax larsenii JCM 13917]UVE50892.1 aminotransferase class V-fold PLP-dependent enzyme [Haloferax larsenii]